jgi:enoyl-CoA hydratase
MTGLRIEERDGIRLVTLDRPPLNALDLALVEDLAASVADADPKRPVVLTGAGKAFSAGVDIKALPDYDEATRNALGPAITRLTAALLAHPAPLVAAANGHAIGGGLVILLCTDYRIATDDPDAKFGLTEAAAGVAFPAGPEAVIAADLPPSWLRNLALTSRRYPAAPLAEARIFDELASSGTMVDLAFERARELAAQGAFRAVKRQVRGPLAKRVAELAAA